MGGPLEGIRVLSFGRMLAGPYASMLLCDLGADVVKIEEIWKGDLARQNGPFIDGISSYFLSINRGKRSITLNLKDERAKKIVFELVKGVDILIENFRPGVMAKLGFGYEVVSELNPKIIYASISGFGQKGPYSERPAFDMIAQGMGGVISITGKAGTDPVRVGYSIGDIAASLFTTLAILASLHERTKSGRGQWIDVGMMDCQVALCENACARYFATGEIPQPSGSRHPLLAPFQVFPTKDGYIVLICFRPEDWEKFCKATGKVEWITDERFKDNEARLKNYSLFEKAMYELMRLRTTKEWMDLFDSHGVMCGPVNNIEQVINDSHVQERDMIEEVYHLSTGKLKVVGTPMKFSRTPCQIKKPSPEIGEHTKEILTELGFSKNDIVELQKANVI